MTLDEAIKHATEVAETQEENCVNAGHDHYTKLEASACAAEHRLLAEWLTELKERREKDEQSSCSEKPNKSDLISRQAAIEAVYSWLYKNTDKRIPSEVLKAVPSAEPEQIRTQMSSADCISRKAAIDAIVAWTVNDRPDAEMPTDLIDRIRDLSSAQPEQQHGRIFQKIVVDYPSVSAYPEHEGKPYFLIKYTEDGQDFIGYGTYKPEVLSEYLIKYFMPSTQPERKKGEWVQDDIASNIFRCSECGCDAPVDPTTGCEIKSNFCQWCGANMRGESDED